MSIASKFKAATERGAASGSRVTRRVMRIIEGDVPSFMELPLLEEIEGKPDMVVVGVPYEGVKIRDRFTFVPARASLQQAIYARTGADKAPDAIRRQSVYYSVDHSGGLMPERGRGFRIVDAVSVCDGGNVATHHTVPAQKTLHAAADSIQAMIGKKAVPIILGGDDTVPYVGMRAVARQNKGKRIAAIKLDSHFDLSWEPKYWAGSQWARAMEAGYLKPENFALIGIRGLRNGMSWHEAAEELGIRYWTLWDVEEQGIANVMAAALKAVTKDCDLLYLSLDLDVIDPAFLPAQKYPDPGGLTAREALRAIRVAVDTGPRLCGFDMACLGPDFDLNGLGAQLAARCAVEVIADYGHRFGRKRK